MAKLPVNINYVCKPCFDSYRQQGTNRVSHMVYQAFPVDASNKPGMKTALDWAEGRWSNNKETAIIETHPNSPMTDVKIMGIEGRSQNGKVYKALVRDRYYVDLRIDVVFDLMTNGCIEDGIIKSPMVWVRAKGGMRLTRVNSTDYLDSIVVHKPEVYIGKPEPGWIYSYDGHFTSYIGSHNLVKYIHHGSVFDRPRKFVVGHGLIEIRYNINDVQAHNIADTVYCNGYVSGLYSQDIRYNTMVRIIDSNLVEFIDTVIDHFINTPDIFNNSEDIVMDNMMYLCGMYSIIEYAREIGCSIKNAPKIIKLYDWISSLTIVTP